MKYYISSNEQFRYVRVEFTHALSMAKGYSVYSRSEDFFGNIYWKYLYWVANLPEDATLEENGAQQ